MIIYAVVGMTETLLVISAAFVFLFKRLEDLLCISLFEIFSHFSVIGDGGRKTGESVALEVAVAVIYQSW